MSKTVLRIAGGITAVRSLDVLALVNMNRKTAAHGGHDLSNASGLAFGLLMLGLVLLLFTAKRP